jgi:hypothetical protein
MKNRIQQTGENAKKKLALSDYPSPKIESEMQRQEAPENALQKETKNAEIVKKEIKARVCCVLDAESKHQLDKMYAFHITEGIKVNRSTLIAEGLKLLYKKKYA